MGRRGSDPAGFILDGTAGGFENLFGGFGTPFAGSGGGGGGGGVDRVKDAVFLTSGGGGGGGGGLCFGGMTSGGGGGVKCNRPEVCFGG